MLLPPELSKVALGTMQFLWTTDERQAYKILDAYYDLGGNAIDTADMYVNWVPGRRGGEAETIVGKWMRRRNNRSKIFLTTKVGGRVWKGPDGAGLSKIHILKAIDRSLKRLQTSYVDLYLAHWPDPETPVQETLEAFKSLTRSGKIRYVGCSNYSPTELQEFLETAKQLGMSCSFLQAYYNLIDRRTFEDQLRPLVQAYDLRVMAYGPLAGGFLSGAYRQRTPLPAHARAEFVTPKMTKDNFALLGQLDVLENKYGKSVAQVALAWLLQQDCVTTVISGADTTEQVRNNYVTESDWLSAGDVAELTRMALSANR